MTGVTDLLFTPEEVADQLGLHVRTVRRYIRDGQLAAVKVGRRYRITRDALAAFTGVTPAANEVTAARPFTEVSTIVSIDDLSRDRADRLTTLLVSSARNRPRDGALRIETIYYPERNRLKVVCNGDLVSTTSMLALINTLIENPS